MNLQSKFLYAIGSAFIITFAMAQLVQIWNVREQVGGIGDKVISAMNESGQQAVDAIQERERAVMALTGHFLERSVAASLERGEMEKFRRLVEDQKEVPGLLEFSLYNTDNTVGYSTRPEAMGRTLQNDVAQQIAANHEAVTIEHDEKVQVFIPQHMNSDCVRCHREWSDKVTAGILYVEMSTESLMQAKDQTDKALETAKGHIQAALGKTENSMIYASLSAAVATLVVLGIILILLIRVQLTQRFSRFLESFEKFSTDGDLTCHISDNSEDELGQLSRGFCDFTGKLSTMVSNIRELAERVNNQSDSILDSSRTISKGTESQLTNLSEVATAVTEMAHSANSVAENASHASSTAKASSKAAESGKVVIDDTLRRIQDIAASNDEARGASEQMIHVAEEVRVILDSIGAISDQTSLLALNAAIEAARAGESGRGFAVVADEVRNLASRAAVATKQVADAIDRIDTSADSVKTAIDLVSEKVTEGNTFATKAGQHLADIVHRANEIATFADQVAAATREQSAVSENISSSTNTLLGSAGKNAEAADQAAEYSRKLRQEAHSLTEMIRHFKT